MSSGDGTPIPLPWSEILPLLGLFSFIHLNYENRIRSTCKKLQPQTSAGKRILRKARFGNNGSLMDECKMLRLKNGGELAYAEYVCAKGEVGPFFPCLPS